jgi:DNA-binding phage protein
MMKKTVNYNQSGARERGVEMLATAVARLVGRCSCMSVEMRLRFMARLLDNFVDADSLPEDNRAESFSLEAVMQSAERNPEEAVSRAAQLLTRSLTQEQGLNREGLYRFYDVLFERLIPREINPRFAAA